jgi:predicted O-methyltransferase YrrM
MSENKSKITKISEKAKEIAGNMAKIKFSEKARKYLKLAKKWADVAYIRKKYTFYRAKTQKSLKVSGKLLGYIDSLLYISETTENAFVLKSASRTDQAYMQIPYSQGRFYEFLIKSTGAKNVLEIGVFKGFSTVFIARALPEGGLVYAIDRDARPIVKARQLWNHFGLSDKVHFELGEADEILEKLSSDKPSIGFFDIAFVDASKEKYQYYVEQSMKLVKKGGVVVIDNTLWKGLVQYNNTADNGAEHLKKFNQWLHQTYGENVCIIPAWDGISILYKSLV